MYMKKTLLLSIMIFSFIQISHARKVNPVLDLYPDVSDIKMENGKEYCISGKTLSEASFIHHGRCKITSVNRPSREFTEKDYKILSNIKGKRESISRSIASSSDISARRSRFGNFLRNFKFKISWRGCDVKPCNLNDW